MPYFLEMSSGWNFPARVSPSYEISELSQAELGHFNFRARFWPIFDFELKGKRSPAKSI